MWAIFLKSATHKHVTTRNFHIIPSVFAQDQAEGSSINIGALTLDRLPTVQYWAPQPTYSWWSQSLELFTYTPELRIKLANLPNLPNLPSLPHDHPHLNSSWTPKPSRRCRRHGITSQASNVYTHQSRTTFFNALSSNTPWQINGIQPGHTSRSWS